MNERMRTNKSCFFLCFVCVNALDLLHVALCGAVWRCVALCGAVDSGAALRPSLGSESKVSRPGPAPASASASVATESGEHSGLAEIAKQPYPYAPWCWNISQHLPEQNQPNVGKYIHGAYGIHIPFPLIIWCSENHNVLKGKGNLREPKTLH